ncbi:MAG TPA: hypothetical protein VFO89_02430, partial [Thermoanaerobaculia bacterium]|nr:hypothetical protein [Thermoanaerobaculia bacterium]
APPVEYYQAERVLASAPRYFDEELAITRLNLCAACFRPGELDRYQPLIERLIADLDSHRVGRFYSEGVMQLVAAYELVFGDAATAICTLESLGTSAQVYPVKQSSLRTLEMIYARNRDTINFLRIKSALTAAAVSKGMTFVDEAMAAAAQRTLSFARWYFVSLPAKRVYWPSIRVPFAAATP